MKVEFNTSKGDFSFVKVSDLAFYTDHTVEGVCYVELENGRVQNIDTGDKKVKWSAFVEYLTEKQWAEVVDYNPSQYVYKNYTGFLDQAWDCNTATKSGKSLMDSLEVYLENPYADKDGYPNSKICSICQNDQTGEWQFVDDGIQGLFDICKERTGSWLLIKYL